MSIDLSMTRSKPTTTDGTAIAESSDLLIGQETVRYLPLAVLAFSFALVIYAFLVKASHPADINLDCATILQMSKMLLEGKELYVEIMEYNLPFPIYGHAVPILIAKFLHLPLITCFHLCVTVIALLSILACYSLVRIINREPNTALALLLSIGVLQTTVAYDFGQREHLFVLLCAPFVLLRCCRWTGCCIPKVSSILIGLMCGFGLTIKPFLIIPVVGAELFWFLTKRKTTFLWSVEVLVACVVAASQLLYFFLMSETARLNFFDFLLPMVLRGYSAMNSSLWIALSLHDARGLALAAVLAGALAIALRRHSSLLLPMLAWTIGAYLEFVLQTKNWSYHLIPFYFSVVSLICMELWILFSACLIGLNINHEAKMIQHQSAILLTKIFVMMTVAVLLGCSAYGGKSIIAMKQGDSNAEHFECQEIIEQNSRPGDRVAILDTIEAQSPLLVRLDRGAGSRYLCVFPFIMLESMKLSPDTLREQESRVVHEVNADFERLKPRLVIINAGANLFTPVHFSLVQKLAEFGLYDGALKHYKLLKQIGKYQVWVR